MKNAVSLQTICSASLRAPILSHASPNFERVPAISVDESERHLSDYSNTHLSVQSTIKTLPEIDRALLLKMKCIDPYCFQQS